MEEEITMSKVKTFKDMISLEIPWKEGSNVWSYSSTGVVKLKDVAKKGQKHLASLEPTAMLEFGNTRIC